MGLQAVEGEAEGDQQQERHDHAQPAFAQAMFDVIRRAAAVLAFAVATLVQLAEGAFDEAAGHTHQRRHPHPEHRAGATEGHGDADTGNIARTDAAGEAEHQRLEGAELFAAAAQAVAKYRKHVGEVTQLNETRADREVTAQTDNEHDQYLAREEVVNDFKHGVFLAFNGFYCV
ncbi:hypothetical protein D3C78_1106600 [compost metagenome]